MPTSMSGDEAAPQLLRPVGQRALARQYLALVVVDVQLLQRLRLDRALEHLALGRRKRGQQLLHLLRPELRKPPRAVTLPLRTASVSVRSLSAGSQPRLTIHLAGRRSARAAPTSFG